MKKHLKYLLIGILWLCIGGLKVIAQDGQALFKSKCATCHNLDKNSIGPMLQGVKAKWIAANEQVMLYDWVKGSEALLETGASKMALAISEFSITAMPTQEVTNEEVDAILDFVDSYVAPKSEEIIDKPKEDAEVHTIPNYGKRLNLFYALIASIILFLLVINGMSKSIQSLLRSDYFKNKLRESDNSKSGGLKALMILIVMSGFFTPSIYALSFVKPNAGENMPWLIVEMADIYALVAVNIMLVGVVLYLKKIFREAMKVVNPEPEPKYVDGEVIRKMNKIMTNAVPIEEEESILLEHEYDGIHELDNNLPPWWVWMFYATIVFAIVYIFNYHILGTADLQIAEYEKEMAQSEIEVQEYLESMAMNVDESNVTLMEDEESIDKGGGIFQANCIVCHAEKGGGDIGPNLTDNTWIYGFDIATVFGTIKNGTSNGMPEHKSKLNPIQLQQVSSFILSMKEVVGKEPEGEVIK